MNHRSARETRSTPKRRSPEVAGDRRSVVDHAVDHAVDNIGRAQKRVSNELIGYLVAGAVAGAGAGAGAVGGAELKLTFGATEIAFSFSTVNCSFTL